MLLTSCASNRSFGEASNIELTTLQELPVPEIAGYHRIGPQEVLEINVAGSEFLSGKRLTDPEAQIDFPLVGLIDLSGLTPVEASQRIADRLRGEYVLRPAVSVIPEEIEPLSFSVGGQVKNPGKYPARSGLTLMRAVNLAAGQTDIAKLEEVMVFRTVKGQKYIGIFNLQAIQRGNYADPRIYPDDVVIVGENAGRRDLQNLFQFLPIITTAAIVIDRLGQ